jgi:HD-GYP domain-containing protein (c-di-GMP phosphodiesterase class II)
MQPATSFRPIQKLELFCDVGRPSDELAQKLALYFDVHRFGIDGIRARRPGQLTIFDIDVHDAVRGSLVKRWLEGAPPHAKSVIILSSNDISKIARARATGPGMVFSRPFLMSDLLDYLLDRDCSVGKGKPPGLEVSIADGSRTLDTIFNCVKSGVPLNKQMLSKASEQIVGQIGYSGLSDWVDTVRKHHHGTYQHCLLVTGVAVAFARHLGFSANDQSFISLAGMVHDLGKANIAVEILDKPTALDEHEWEVMREHPRLGYEALAATPDISKMVLDIVLHHHEYLDGTGYPHRLRGSEISDVVRLMTVADVFGALLENRPYKKPLPSRAAYKILTEMGPKLDYDMVREFESVAAA